jgi:hypothetical protein
MLTTSSDNTQHDIIIGTNLMATMGLDMIYFCMKQICWKVEVSILMKHRGTINHNVVAQYLYNVANDLPLIQVAENRQKRTDVLTQITQRSTSETTLLPKLSVIEKRQLANLLKTHNKLFASLIQTDRRCETISRASVPCATKQTKAH